MFDLINTPEPSMRQNAWAKLMIEPQLVFRGAGTSGGSRKSTVWRLL
jgi:hypothetical protein